MARSDVTYDIYYEDGACPECKRSSPDGTEHKPWCPSIHRARQDAFEAKVTGIVEDGIARLQAAALRDEADIWLGPQRQPEENAATPAADVQGRSALTGLPCAPVGNVRDHSDAEAAACVVGYNRALADSLKSAKQILDQLAEQHWPLVALVTHIKERLAEDSGRLGWSFSGDDLLREVGRVGVEAGVRVRSNGDG